MLIVIVIIYLLSSPASACDATRTGLLLWFNQVLPALFPFTVISSILLQSGLLEWLDNWLSQKHFFFSSTELFIFFCGFLFGFPIGSKLSSDCFKNGLLSQKQAQILCCCTNNLSPAFVLGYVLVQKFHGEFSALFTLLILYIPSFLTGIILLIPNRVSVQDHKKTASRFQLDMQIIDAGIISGFETLIKLCGYIVLFSILGSILQKYPGRPPMPLYILTTGLEVTNGIAMLADSVLPENIIYVLAISILSWGGLSGIAQAHSMLAPAGLSISRYLCLKLFCSAISVLLAICYCRLLF